MAKRQRKQIARLNARLNGTQNYSGRAEPLQFGMVQNMGTVMMFHKPGSQNRKK